MNGSDKPEFSSTEIKNGYRAQTTNPNLVRVREILSRLREILPAGTAGNFKPVEQRRGRIRVSPRESGECRWLDETHG